MSCLLVWVRGGPGFIKQFVYSHPSCKDLALFEPGLACTCQHGERYEESIKHLNRELPGTNPDETTRQLAVAPWSVCDCMVCTVEMRSYIPERSECSYSIRAFGVDRELTRGGKDPIRGRDISFTQEDCVFKTPNVHRDASVVGRVKSGWQSNPDTPFV